MFCCLSALSCWWRCTVRSAEWGSIFGHFIWCVTLPPCAQTPTALIFNTVWVLNRFELKPGTNLYSFKIFNHQSTVSFSLCKDRLDCSAPNKTCLASQVKYMTMSSVLEFALYGICLYIIFLTFGSEVKMIQCFHSNHLHSLCPRCCCPSMVHLVSFVLVMLPFHYRFIAKKVLGVCFEKWASLIESCHPKLIYRPTCECQIVEEVDIS